MASICAQAAGYGSAGIGDDVDIEIIEAHHRPRWMRLLVPHCAWVKSSPRRSGVTFRRLRHMDEGNRCGQRDTIGFPVRAGATWPVITVLFAADGERVEITHKASSRMTSPRAPACRAMAGREASGLYDMQDVLGLK